jgi:hypothetical protein
MRLLLVAMVTLLAAGCRTPRLAADPVTRTDTTAVFAFERAIEQAQVRKDITFLDSATDSALRFTHAGNTSGQTKAQWLRGVSGSTFYKRDVEEQRVEFHDDIAITTGRIRIERQYPDPAGAKYTISYLRVYRCIARGCRLVSHYTTASTLLPRATRPPPNER